MASWSEVCQRLNIVSVYRLAIPTSHSSLAPWCIYLHQHPSRYSLPPEAWGSQFLLWDPFESQVSNPISSGTPCSAMWTSWTPAARGRLGYNIDIHKKIIRELSGNTDYSENNKHRLVTVQKRHTFRIPVQVNSRWASGASWRNEIARIGACPRLPVIMQLVGWLRLTNPVLGPANQCQD